MTQENFPPLRIREVDGSPNVIPVYEIQVSNGTLTNLGGGRVALATGAGGGGGGITVPLIIASGGTGTSSAFSDGSIIITSGADGNYTANTAQLMWQSSHNVLSVGRISTGAKMFISRGFPGGTQIDWGGTFGSSIVFISEQTGGSDHRFLMYSNTSRTSEIGFCDNRTTTDGVARGYLQYDHNADALLLSSSGGGNTTIDIRNGRVSIGNPAGTPTIGIPLTVGGSGRITSVLILGAQATSAGHAVRADRTITASTGLTGLGNMMSDSLVAVNTNIRDKMFVFYAAGAMNTAMLATKSRIRIPYTCEPIRADIAVEGTPLVFAITCDILQYVHPNSSPASSLFTSANLLQVPATRAAGSSVTFADTVLGANSYLGINIIQVGTATAPGSNMTITLVVRTS